MNMNRDDIISVIIPVYNSERYLTEAIESVLRQSVPPQEIIVVDDGSTVETTSVINNFSNKVRYVYQKKSGVAAARNRGLELSKGDLIAFIDADDIWLKNKIELQLHLIHQNPKVELIIGFLKRVFKKDNKDLFKVFDGDESGIFVMQLGSTLIRREVFRKVGNFDEGMKMSEDLDWFLRVRESGVNVEVHKEVVQLYRQHEKNTTKDKSAGNHYMLKAFKKSLDRRRKSGFPDVKIPNSQSDMDEIVKFWQYKQ